MSSYTCPFCESEIDEQLALHGGRCSKCFGDIPGEEAATDPGETVKKKQAASDARRAMLRIFAPMIIALPVLGLLVGFSVFKLMESDPELEMMDFDQVEFAMLEMDLLLVATPDDKEETTAQKGGKRSSSKSREVERKVRLGTVEQAENGDEKELLAALGSETVEPGTGLRGARSSGSADAMPDFLSSGSEDSLQTGMKMTTSSMGTPDVSVAKTRLKDRKEIQKMVLRVLRNQLPRLRSCYESRLRSDSRLAGKWTLSFTVNSEGGVERAKAVGQTTRDRMLETCVSAKISKWRFQPIRGSVPVKKTVTFDRR